VKVLFIHAHWNSSAEYGVHQLLAENVDPELIDCYFIWQSDTQNPANNRGAKLANTGRNFFFDFGRDYNLSPQPSTKKRAFLSLSRLPGSLLFLLKKIKEVEPDVIYTSQARYDLWLVSLIRPFIRTPHFLHLHYTPGPWLGSHAFKTLLKAKHIIVVSDYIRTKVIECGVPSEVVEIVFNSANIERFSIPKNGSLRQEFGWSVDTPVVVAAGRLVVGKGYPLLIEAFKKVVEEIPNAQLVICGEGSDEEALKQKVEKLALSQNIKFLGYRNDVPLIYANANVFSLPTEMEPFGLVFVEAMASGLPTVACRSGGVPEIVVDGETGLLSELGDVVALANNLLTYLKNPALAESVGRAGKERVFHYFTPKQVSQKWAEIIYQRLR